MSEKLFSARRWKDPPIYRVVKVGGSKEDKIKGINWGLKNGVLTKEEYDHWRYNYPKFNVLNSDKETANE